jgi:predicted transcriptional regulator
MERTNVHIHPDDKKSLRAIAKKKRVTVAHLIRQAILEYLDREQKGKK